MCGLGNKAPWMATILTPPDNLKLFSHDVFTVSAFLYSHTYSRAACFRLDQNVNNIIPPLSRRKIKSPNFSAPFLFCSKCLKK
jgi:hypothetical protein